MIIFHARVPHVVLCLALPQVDPKGDRTIGVLTKLDLMDPGKPVASKSRTTASILREQRRQFTVE